MAGDDEVTSAATGLADSGPNTVVDGGLIALAGAHLELVPAEPIALNGQRRNARLVWRPAGVDDGAVRPA